MTEFPTFKVRLFVIQSHYYNVSAATEEDAVACARRQWGEGNEGIVPDDDARIHDHEVEEAEDA